MHGLHVSCNPRWSASVAREPVATGSKLNQFAIGHPGRPMLIRQPQKQKSDNRNDDTHWQNDSHVTRREIMRHDHLVNVPCSCAPGERKRRYERCKSKRQACFECNHSCNTHTQTGESYFSLKRALFPPDKLCGRVTYKHVEHKVNEVVYPYREKQVVREQCLGNYISAQRFRLVDQCDRSGS